VSVVIPCYNYGRYLSGAVASALDQEGIDVDVLIVDDASTDDSAQIAKSLAAADPRVDVLVHELNQGHIRTYNDGLAKARGNYLVLLSADDLLTRDALTRAVSLMEAHPRVGFVYGYAHWFRDVPPEGGGRVRSWSVWRGADWLRLATSRARCFVSSPEVVMRREAFADTNGYDPRLPHSGDFDMWLRTAARWDVGRVNGPAQALYRDHGSNMHSTQFGGWLRDLTERRATFDIFFTERVPGRDDLVRMRASAKKALAREALRRGLQAHRDGEDASLVADYLAFSTETWPPVVHGVLWRVAQAGPLRGRQLPAVAARRFASRARRHLVWRHARRYGT